MARQQHPLPLSFADEKLIQRMLMTFPLDKVLAGVPSEENDQLTPPVAPAAAAQQPEPSGAHQPASLGLTTSPKDPSAAPVRAVPTWSSHPPSAAVQPACGSGEKKAVEALTAAAAAPPAPAKEDDDEGPEGVIIHPELLQASLAEDSMEARSASPTYDTQPSSFGDGDDGNSGSGSGSGAMPAACLGGRTPPVFIMTNCHSPNMCGHCGTHTTSGCWRRGWPLDLAEEGAMTEYINLCNKCGLRYKAGKLGPQGDVRDGAPTPPTPPPPPPRRTPPAPGPRGKAIPARAKLSAAAAALMAATEPMAGSLSTAGEVDDAFKSIRALLGTGRGGYLPAGGAAGAASPQAAAAAANLAAATAAELAAASRAQLALIAGAAEPAEAEHKPALAVATGREAHPRKRTMVSSDVAHANGAAAAGSVAGAEAGATAVDGRPASRNRRRSKKARGADDVEPSDIDMADALLQLGNGNMPSQLNGDSDDLLLSHETLDNIDQNGGHTVRPQPLPVGMRDASAAAARQQRQVTHVVPTHLRNGRTKSMAGSGGGAGAAGRTLSRNGAMQAAVEAGARQAAIAQRQALVAAWSSQDVQTWLNSAGCGEAAPLFGSHGIDGPALVGLVRLARDEAAGRLHGLLRQEVGLKGSLGQQLRLVDHVLSLFEPSK